MISQASQSKRRFIGEGISKNCTNVNIIKTYACSKYSIKRYWMWNSYLNYHTILQFFTNIMYLYKTYRISNQTKRASFLLYYKRYVNIWVTVSCKLQTKHQWNQSSHETQIRFPTWNYVFILQPALRIIGNSHDYYFSNTSYLKFCTTALVNCLVYFHVGKKALIEAVKTCIV